jgi:hypothetical protein
VKLKSASVDRIETQRQAVLRRRGGDQIPRRHRPLIDDPIKDRVEADSVITRESLGPVQPVAKTR